MDKYQLQANHDSKRGMNAIQFQPALSFEQDKGDPNLKNCGIEIRLPKNDPEVRILDTDHWETFLWECNPQYF